MTKNITKDLTVPLGNGFTMQAEELDCMKSINEICKEFHITRKTLFYYDKIGLLKPSIRVGTQNTKYYSNKKVKQLKQILSYKEAGIPLKMIEQLFKATTEERIKILDSNIHTLELQIQLQQSQIQITKELIKKEKSK